MPTSQTALETTPRPRELAASGLYRIVTGTADNHGAAGEMIAALFPAVSPTLWAASLEEPCYEPAHRLLAKREERVAAHLLIRNQEAAWAGTHLPLAEFVWLGTLPEFRGRGLASLLLQQAESAAAQDGAVLALVKTRQPSFYEGRGYVPCGRVTSYRVRTRELLTRVMASVDLTGKAQTVRPWRQVEASALVRLHETNTLAAMGPLRRSEAYWRWLAVRQAFEQLYVASDGPNRQGVEAACTSIVGYLATRRDRVLELIVAPKRLGLAWQLLQRACADALESGYEDLHLCLPLELRMPPWPALQAVAALAQPLAEDVWLAKVLRGEPILQALGPQLFERARASGLELPVELGLALPGQSWQLVISKKGLRILPDKLGRSNLRLGWPELARTLLGSWDVAAACGANQVTASTRAAKAAAAALFPRCPLWRPPLDDYEA
jgi:GNAT superfamily N-acetyltransferase